MRTIISTLIFILFSLAANAQQVTKSFWDDPFNDPLFPLYVIITFIFIVALLVVLVALYTLKVLNMFIRAAIEEKAAKTGVKYVPEPTLWSKFWNRINAFKPVEKEAEILLDHNYDGIKELDNHLPPWWKWLFYGTIIWAGVYLVVYHITDSLPLMDDEYQNEVAAAQEQKAKLLASKPMVAIDENTLEYKADNAIIQSGRKVFVNNCSSCHNANGEGGIGPNLTDDYWIHKGGIKDIYLTIKNGVQEKGMIPWGPVLSAEQMRDVAFYIKSIRGTNPPNPKAPQGELWIEQESIPKADTVKQSSL